MYNLNCEMVGYGFLALCVLKGLFQQNFPSELCEAIGSSHCTQREWAELFRQV